MTARLHRVVCGRLLRGCGLSCFFLLRGGVLPRFRLGLTFRLSLRLRFRLGLGLGAGRGTAACRSGSYESENRSHLDGLILRDLELLDCSCDGEGTSVSTLSVETSSSG